MVDNHTPSRARDDSAGWPFAARFAPSPATAAQKAALAAGQIERPSRPMVSTKARLGIGAAAVVVAVAVPNLSLGAMVGSFGAPYFGGLEPSPEQVSEPTAETVSDATKVALSNEVWSPADQPAGELYAETILADAISAQERAIAFTSRTQIGDAQRERPVAALASGAQELDLAIASLDLPTGFVTPSSLGQAEGPAPLFDVPADTIRTPSVEIEQITDLGLVVRATPEEASEQGTRLSVATSTARTDAISNSSVEAAFAGAIDASNAVRNALPIAKPAAPSQPRTGDVQRAIPIGATPQELRGAAAAETALVPKTKMDARVNGVLTGSVDFQQGDGTIAIRLRSVANVMREQFSKFEYSEIVGGQSIDRFVSLAELQAAGIPISYNPAYDEVEFGIDYQDAPNAKKVQVDQISVAPLGQELTAIEQIPR